MRAILDLLTDEDYLFGFCEDGAPLRCGRK